MTDIFGNTLSKYIKSKDFNHLKKLDNEQNISAIPFRISKKGFFLLLNFDLPVSSCGDRIWGSFVFEFTGNKSKVIMYDFKRQENLVYDREANFEIVSIAVSEKHNLVMTGCLEEAVVLHDLASGKTLKKIDLKFGGDCLLYILSNIMVVGNGPNVWFVDLEANREICVKSFDTKIENIYFFGSNFIEKNKLKKMICLCLL